MTSEMSYLQQVVKRLYSSVASSRLAVLRKKTGFPILKCKEALSNNADDLDKAEKWLNDRAQEEGWAKVEKLKNRTASQGLIGLLLRGNKAAMLEINCETDFVAKNKQFQALASTATRAVFDHPIPTSDDALLSVHAFTSEEIGEVKVNSKTVGDTVAEAVGFLAENIVLRRACVWCASKGIICGHVYHDQVDYADELGLGKYAALVHLQSVEGGLEAELKDLGRTLCQQVIAMSPKVVTAGQDGVVDPALVLTQQEFILDESMNIGDMLATHGARVTKFLRYGLAEDLDS